MTHNRHDQPHADEPASDRPEVRKHGPSAIARFMQPDTHDNPQTLRPRHWTSQSLLGIQDEVHIHHGTIVYRLRRTALGKLILTK